MDDNNKYDICYECPVYYQCGFPYRPGCDLCKQYGKGNGQLLNEYTNKEITLNGKTYKPKCIFCKGTKDSIGSSFFLINHDALLLPINLLVSNQ